MTDSSTKLAIHSKIEKWSTDNVSAWLESINQGTTVTQLFRTNHIDGQTLLSMRKTEWLSLNLLQHQRVRIRRALGRLLKGETSFTPHRSSFLSSSSSSAIGPTGIESTNIDPTSDSGSILDMLPGMVEVATTVISFFQSSSPASSSPASSSSSSSRSDWPWAKLWED